jgi:hypothetical protein
LEGRSGRMMVITRPEHDETTRYLSAWSGILLKEAKRAGFDVIDLHRKKANRKDFEGRVKKLDPQLVVLQGHGNERCVTGHENEPLVTAGENETVLDGRVTYAVSCNAANVLGASVASRGHAAFIGYRERFVFSYRFDRIHRPLDDDRAAPFMEMSNQVTRCLIKGHSAEEARQRSLDVGMDNVKRLMSTASNPDARFDAFNLLWNIRHCVCLGEASKKLK